MDIGSQNSYPANSLSNFSAHQFIIDNVVCASMEGFLQSLKFKDAEMQKYVCSLIGIKAKNKGRKKNWRASQVLYWQGKEYKRDSKEYQELIKRAYKELCKNQGFQNAILASGNATYTHSIGKSKQSETVLTEKEFISMLNMCRKIIINSEV